MTMKELVNIAHGINQRILNANQALDLAGLAAQGVEDIMVDPKVADIVMQLDVATNAIAARIQKLIDAGGLSPESQAALESEVAKLQALGADPAHPIPDPGPPVTGNV